MEKKTINYELMADLVDKDIKPYLAKNPTIRILVNGTPNETYEISPDETHIVFRNSKHCVWLFMVNNKRNYMFVHERV